MKFIADAMLGRLAKWLRLLGFDVLYYPEIEDRQIIKIAREQGRTILTRDTRLMKCKGLTDPVFIGSDFILDQLDEVKERLNLRDADPIGRCVLCNGALLKISKKVEIRDFVPDFIYHNLNEFTRCTDCGKVYWEGTHYERFKEKLGGIVSAPAAGMGRKAEIED